MIYDFGPAFQILAWLVIIAVAILMGLAFLVGAWIA